MTGDHTPNTLAFGQMPVSRVMYPLKRWSGTYLRSCVSVPGGTTTVRAVSKLCRRYESLSASFVDFTASPLPHVCPLHLNASVLKAHRR